MVHQMNDEEVAKKWKDEVCSNVELDRFTSNMADWCIAELRYVASFHSASPGNPPPIVIIHGDVVKSDTAELKHALQETVNKFQVGISDVKVLDLVHPSLYPLVYGRTRILCDGERTTLDDCIERCGQSEIANISKVKHKDLRVHLVYESLKTYSSDHPVRSTSPANVQRLQVTSIIYILGKKEGLIERLIGAAIPLWDVESFHHRQRTNYTAVKYDPDPSTWPKSDQPQQGPG